MLGRQSSSIEIPLNGFYYNRVNIHVMVDWADPSLLVIGTFLITIGTVVGLSISIIIQKDELRLQTALEILKMLGTERSRKSRILVYEDNRIYKKDKNLVNF